MSAEQTQQPGAVHRAYVELRWSDFDRFGHMNNAQYVEIVQESRVRFSLDNFVARGLPMPMFVVRHLEADYRIPIVPSPSKKVLVESTVTKVGRSSFTTLQEIKDDEGRTACAIHCVQVALDKETLQPREITPEEVEILTMRTA
ncbi:acyl-CoA thioesterase [Corynebacterium sp. zg-331]|uniref:acyl-CoA thioesterase n=1 Tax=unclassified Corynebacterium TaxID=2624378 RepID=UPI00128B9BEB|nr:MULTISPECIES: thioesterase family protein [unclassified Corynebacterium]MBC3185016.1 acyl-CoA thioesterase [Corynebacterium sp. zg-331]MPV51516.1 acyl-CoA thioesterase [Corynebacterium sp. zg331]